MTLFDKLKNVMPQQKDSVSDYYWAIAIAEGRVSVALWEYSSGKVVVLETSLKDYQAKEELTAATAAAIDEVLGDQEFTAKKAIFGVPSFWLSQKELLPEYNQLLEKLAQDLDLEPNAYVSQTSALVNFLTQKDLSAPSAILIGVSPQNLSLAVIHAGKILKEKSIKRTGVSLPEEVENTINSLGQEEYLPSRILLYGDSDLEEARQELLTTGWQEKLSFLHLPKIDILPEDSEVKAVTLAGATEGGLEFVTPKAAKNTPPFVDEQKVLRDEFGFVRGQDVLDAPPQFQPEPQILRSEIPALPSSKEFTPSVGERPKINLARLFDFIGEVGERVRLGAILAVGAVFVLSVLTFFFLWFVPRGEITIYLQPKTLEKEQEITASPGVTSLDPEKKLIPGTVVESDLKDTKKALASGKKTIGDKAKGEVIIYNKTDSSKTFGTGTLLLGPKDLKFSLDDGVTVASQSAATEGISFGKAKVKVTASQIGADSNLPAGTEFGAGSFSKSIYSARNDTIFSGGTSREVTIVSEEDRKRLEATLSAELKEKTKGEIVLKITPNQRLLDEAIKLNITKKTFDKDVGDEAGAISLTLEAHARATVYSEDDLKQILTKISEISVPEGYETSQKESETSTKVLRLADNGNLVFSGILKAKLVRKLDQEQIKKDLSGKTPQIAQEYLGKLPDVLGSEIKIFPGLPFLSSTLPRVSGNIKIKIQLR